MSDKEEASEEEITDADYYLPVANVSRIMKTRLPPQGKVAKEAKEAVQECVSEFICFITSEANDRCVQEKRKTINGDDILWAMTNLGFDRYIEPLKIYLQKYRETLKPDRGQRRMEPMINDYQMDTLDMNNYPANYQDISRPPP